MAKKDFSGKTKTKDTYDKDWQLKKVKGPHGTFSMAWVTDAQARKMRNQDKQDKAFRAEQAQKSAPAAVPGVPAAPGTAPILTAPLMPAPTTPLTPPGPPQAPAPDTAVPAWWINQAIVNPTNPDQQFANAANAMLPTLAPEDQRTLANYLATNFKDIYGGYASTDFGPAPTEITGDIRKQYLNPQRAQLAVSLLDKMKTASGAQNMGAGYDFLKNAVNLMNQFSTGGVMTREKFQQFSNAVSSLGQNATGELSPYGNLAQLFNLPSFSAGPLVSNEANRKLFS